MHGDRNVLTGICLTAMVLVLFLASCQEASIGRVESPRKSIRSQDEFGHVVADGRWRLTTKDPPFRRLAVLNTVNLTCTRAERLCHEHIALVYSSLDPDSVCLDWGSSSS